MSRSLHHCQYFYEPAINNVKNDFVFSCENEQSFVSCCFVVIAGRLTSKYTWPPIRRLWGPLHDWCSLLNYFYENIGKKNTLLNFFLTLVKG